MSAQNIQIPPIQTTTNTYLNALNLSASNDYAMSSNQMQSNQMNSALMNIMTNTSSQQILNSTHQQTMQQPQPAPVKNSNLLTLLSMKTTASSSDDIQPMPIPTTHTSTFKSYPMQQIMKTNTFNQMQQQNSALSTQMGQHMSSVGDRQHQINASVSAIDKEMYRSKSLPMNSTLQLPVMREESFVVC